MKLFLILAMIFLGLSCGHDSVSLQQRNIDTSYLNKHIKDTIEEELIDTTLLSTWIEFKHALLSKNFTGIKRLCLDSIEISSDDRSVNDFIGKDFPKIHDSVSIKKFRDSIYDDYSKIVIHPEELHPFLVNQVLEKKISLDSNGVVSYQFDIYGKQDVATVLFVFRFVKSKAGYKLYKYDSLGVD